MRLGPSESFSTVTLMSNGSSGKKKAPVTS